MRSFFIPAIFLATASCIVEAPSSERSAPQRAQAVVNQVPPLAIKYQANLEDKIEINGATAQPGRGTPGSAVRVTTFFKALAEIDVDYQVFVHVEDADGTAERMNLDHWPTGGNYPTSQWKKGETVADEFSISIPSGSSVRSLNVFVGLWDPKTGGRLRLKNPDQVKNDGNSRVLLLQLPVGN